MSGIGGEGEHVVDHRRACRTGRTKRRQRRLGADLAAFALQAVQQGGLLAANIGAGANPHLHIELLVAAQHAGAEQANGPGHQDRLVHCHDGVRVFGAEIDVAACGADRMVMEGDPFLLIEGMAIAGIAVGKGAAIALVGVADDVFLRRLRAQHGAPLDAGREPCPAAAPQPGFLHVVDDRGGAGFPTGIKWRTVLGAQALGIVALVHRDQVQRIVPLLQRGEGARFQQQAGMHFVIGQAGDLESRMVATALSGL